MVAGFFAGLFFLFLFVSCGVTAYSDGATYSNPVLEFMKYVGYTVMILFCVGCIGTGLYIMSAIGMLYLKIFHLVP